MQGRKPLRIGECIDTKGYKLPCQYVVHAIGPVFQGQRNSSDFFRELTDTFTNILTLAEAKKARSLAIPLISSGNFGGPKEVCANALATALFNFSSFGSRNNIQQIFLVNIDQEATTTLQSTLSELFPTSRENSDEIQEPDIESRLNTSKAAKFKTNEGIEVLVVTGDITKGKFNAIVNAANGDLIHAGGVAAAIARAAGKRIQDESKRIITQRKGPLKVSECVATGGYNLGCKVVHAVGPVYKKCQTDEEFVDLLKTTFINAISHANLPIEAKKIAIPLISSGIYGGPTHLCASALAHAVNEFSRNEKHLAIRHIWLVDIDEETTKVVQGAFEDIFESRPFSNSEKDSDECIQTESGIRIIGLCGDISKEDVDVIVNPTTPTLKHNGGVAGSISDAAGYKLQQCCNYIYKEDRKHKDITFGETVVTGNFDLPCNNIIHTLAPTFTRSAPDSFYKLLLQTYESCLQCANSSMEVKTIAFPLLSVGTTGGPNETSAKAFAEAVMEFESSNSTTNLVNIKVVCQEETALAVVRKILSAYFYSRKEIDRTDLPTKGIEQTDDKYVTEYVFKTPEKMEIRLRTEDIAKQAVDVIFNYTDSKLTNNGNISQHICSTAGPGLQEECRDIIKKRKTLSPGSCIATKGHKLLCKHVLHVSPPLRGTNTEEVFTSVLTRTYVSGLLLAKQTLRAKSVALSLMQSEESIEFDAKVLATSLDQFSRQSKSNTSTTIIVYMICTTSPEVYAIKKALSDNFSFVGSFRSERHFPLLSQGSEGFEQVGAGHAKDLHDTTQIPSTRKHRANKPSTASDGSHSGETKEVGVRWAATDQQGQRSSSVKLTGYEKHPQSDSTCRICQNPVEKLHVLEGCRHKFCITCVNDKVTPQSKCLECESLYGVVSESNLGGKMTYYQKTEWQLEGVSQRGAIVMEFNIPTGNQNVSVFFFLSFFFSLFFICNYSNSVVIYVVILVLSISSNIIYTLLEKYHFVCTSTVNRDQS